MPETAFDDVYDGQGNRISRTPRTVSDAEIQRRDAPARLRQFYPTARQWAQDAAAVYAAATAGNRALTAAEQREFMRRMGQFFDGFADFLQERGLDQ